MKYNVHLYIACRVQIPDIEANSQEEAVKLAEFAPDLALFFANLASADTRETPVWDETCALGALVDEQGDDEFLNTRYHVCKGAKLYATPD